MILIRGIKGEAYAREIEKGIVGCRDVLSALLEPPVTGYEFSDYYEKNLVKALCHFSKTDSIHLHDPDFLHSLLIDYFVPYIYLTYFHILNENSIKWLDNFDDDYHFIAMNVKLDRITKTAIGEEFFGARMSYVDNIRDIAQDGNLPVRAACMCAIEKCFTNKVDMNIPLQIYNTLSFPLLHREQDEKFTDIENEFRIIAFDCPRFSGGKMTQLTRDITLTGKSGIAYHGTLRAKENVNLESNMRVLRTPTKPLREILAEENGIVTLNSKFKAIDIRTISDDYAYIGNKVNCRNFIERMLTDKLPDIYVDRTVQKTYDIKKLKSAQILPGYKKVDY